MVRLTIQVARKMYLRFVQTKASLPEVNHPFAEYGDMILVAQQSSVALMYNLRAEQFEVNSRHCTHLDAMLELYVNSVIIAYPPGLNGPRDGSCVVFANRNTAKRYQFWEAHAIYRDVLSRDGLADNSAFAGFDCKDIGTLVL